MIQKRSEKFAIKSLPPYFFSNQYLDNLLAPQASKAFKQRLKAILPRLDLDPVGEAKTALFFQDRYQSKPIFQRQITELVNSLSSKGVLFIVSHRDWGVRSLLDFLEKEVGADNVEVLERGMAGFRLIGIRPSTQINPVIEDTEINVQFEIKPPTGKKLSVKLKSEQSLFSANKLDQGTKLILECIDFTQYERVLEIGSGWGAIGITALLTNSKVQVVMMDNNPRAIAAVSKNLINLQLESRAEAHIADSPAHLEGDFDLVISHPPYHQSNEALVKLFGEAKQKLSPEGVVIIGTDSTYRDKFLLIFEKLGLKTEVISEKGNYLVIMGRQ